jgi:hypothetical protein
MTTQLKHGFERCEPAAPAGATTEVYRLKTPAGWIVSVWFDGKPQPTFFYPDPSHAWDVDDYVVRESL